ncbi:MAG: MATE family efflux transporter [Cyclobacteriaceae bacterium]|nr:MATE family efflux transporter [Cyclobacteriaceae bacterium]
MQKFFYILSRFFSDFAIAFRGGESNFTSGSIRRAVFMLSIPMILEMVMESLFAVVDIYFVGKVSVEAIATVTLTESIIMIIYSIAIGFSMAATAMVSRRIGENNTRKASFSAAQVMVVTLLVSFLFSITGLLYAPDILRVMGGSEEVISSGQGYTRIMLGGNLTIMYLFLINAIFRGAGNASVAMRSLWLANIINIALDPVFIFGLGPIPAFGVEGAAIATNIGRGIGVVYQLYSLYSDKSLIRIKARDFIPQRKMVLRIINVSLGGIGQYLIGTASWIFMVRISAEFGTAVLAGYALAFRTIMFTILPSWGLSNAAATLVGQNLGAGKPDRAEKSVWLCARYNMYFLGAVSLVFILLAESIVSLFTREPEVIKYGAIALQYIGFGYVFYSYGMVISQAFNGAGDTRTPTIINFFCFWLFEVPLAYLLAIVFGFGPKGIFTAIALAVVLLAVVSIILFKQGKWKHTKI